MNLINLETRPHHRLWTIQNSSPLEGCTLRRMHIIIKISPQYRYFENHFILFFIYFFFLHCEPNVFINVSHHIFLPAIIIIVMAAKFPSIPFESTIIVIVRTHTHTRAQQTDFLNMAYCVIYRFSFIINEHELFTSYKSTDDVPNAHTRKKMNLKRKNGTRNTSDTYTKAIHMYKIGHWTFFFF